MGSGVLRMKGCRGLSDRDLSVVLRVVLICAECCQRGDDVGLGLAPRQGAFGIGPIPFRLGLFAWAR